jgi:hypothetical protein
MSDYAKLPRLLLEPASERCLYLYTTGTGITVARAQAYLYHHD